MKKLEAVDPEAAEPKVAKPKAAEPKAAAPGAAKVCHDWHDKKVGDGWARRYKASYL